MDNILYDIDVLLEELDISEKGKEDLIREIREDFSLTDLKFSFSTDWYRECNN